MAIGRCVLMILGDFCRSVQATVSFIILAIAFIGSSLAREGTGGIEVWREVNSIKGTLKTQFPNVEVRK